MSHVHVDNLGRGTTACPNIGDTAAAAPRLRTRTANVVAHAGAVALVGAASGLVALGIGSRLSMRLLALSSGSTGSGLRPESGATPGEFTIDGTMFLLLAGTFSGIVFAVVVAALLARWLPTAGARRTAVVVGLTSLAPGVVLMDPGNRDFGLLGPPALAVALFAACALGYGLLVAVLTARFRAPAQGAARGMCLVIGAAALVITTLAAGSTGVIGLTVAVPIMLLLVAQSIAPRHGSFRWSCGDRVQRLGQWALAAAAVVSLGVLAMRASQILSRAHSV